ncbi:MAG: hypothetical protein NTNFB02_24870 [Nitrospira sp.]
MPKRTKAYHQARQLAHPSETELHIEVVWGAIQNVDADVLAVGHYIGVIPQTAERKLDELVSGTNGKDGERLLITELTRRGAIRGNLGEVIFFPLPKGRALALAGMGPFGTFGVSQLRVLARSIAQVVGLLPEHRTLGTVLIGSGKGNLKVKDAVHAFLEGVSSAFDGGPLGLERLQIVERDLDRALEVLQCVKRSTEQLNPEMRKRGGLLLAPHGNLIENSGGHISPDFGCSMMLAALATGNGGARSSTMTRALHDVLAQLPDSTRKSVEERLKKMNHCGSKKEVAIREMAMQFRLREPDDGNDPLDVPTRVSFWALNKDIHATAITNTTTVTELIIPNRLPLVQRAANSLQDEPTAVLDHAKKLCRFVLHKDLKDVFIRFDPLIIEVDRSLAAVHWEALPSDKAAAPLAVVRPLARQLRTLYSPRPFQPVVRPGLKALVIADPGGPQFPLNGGQKEGEIIASTLRKHGVETTLLIGSPQPGTGAGMISGVPPALYEDVIELLLNGGFDIVHYCGHATFDESNADLTGWIFEGGTLTANELQGMEEAPKLVMANACLSAQLSKNGEADGTRSSPDGTLPGHPLLVAGLADEFFKQGVFDYIGAAWEVPSEPARLFATHFYDTLLSGGNGLTLPIGKAVQEARKKLYDDRETFGPSWAAYQHYGDPMRQLDLNLNLNRPSR